MIPVIIALDCLNFDESYDNSKILDSFFFDFICSVNHIDSADEDHCPKCMINYMNDRFLERIFSHQRRVRILFSIRITDRSVI